MQTISTIFLLIFLAAFAGVIKPYIGNLTRWQFGVAAFMSAMICGATAPASDTVALAEPELSEEPAPERTTGEPSEVKEAVTATVATEEDEDTGPDQAIQMRIVVASQDGVRSRLKDPDSAEFRNVGYYSGGEEGASAVCGEVNAKNSFGGFTGFERFVALGKDIAFLESDVAPSEFAKVWQGVCVKADTDEVQLP
jgi:hypothetical protein